MVNNMGKKSQLYSLSEVFTKLKEISPFIDPILDPGTTGYTSDAYEDDEEANSRISSLSYTEVQNLFIDERVIQLLPDNTYINDDDVLLLININLSLNYFTFKQFYTKLQYKPPLVLVKF